MIALASSNLAGAGYSWNGTLTIAFHGDRVYEYFGVPISVYRALINAESHGTYFHRHIRNHYRYRRVR